MYLSDKDFRSLIRNSILLSIDLIIKNRSGEVLLGQRKNDPAKGYWFVPGGRIYKNETFTGALHRICHSEVGELKQHSTFTFLGMYNHIYEDNFFNDPDFNTHYVAMGIGLQLSVIKMKDSMNDQHENFIFMDIPTLERRKDVHPFTKYYFANNPPNKFF